MGGPTTKQSTSVTSSKTALGVGIGTLALGGLALAAAIFIFSVDDPGGSTTTQTTNQPLQVSDVVRAVSVRDPLESDSFRPQEYYAGRTLVYQQPLPGSEFDTAPSTGRANQALSIVVNPNAVSGGPHFGIPTAHAQATTFSIEPIPFTGMTGQYVLMWYRQAGNQTDQLMTLCLGRTDATRVYVGSDGSTYTDSRLRNRTTTRPCSQLKTMNGGVEQLSEGAVNAEKTNEGIFNLVRSIRVLAHFDRGQYQPPEPIEGTDPAPVAQIIAHFRTPLWVGFAPTTDDQGNFLAVVPSAIFRLVDSQTTPGRTVVQYLCHPGAVYNETTTGPVIFFDKDGNAYEDFFLTKRLSSKNCRDIVASSLRIGDVTALAANPDRWDFGSVYVYQQDVLGMVSSASLDFPTFSDGEAFATPVGPLSSVGARNSSDPMSGNIPQLTLTVTGMLSGQPVTRKLCFPATVIPAPNPQRTHLKFYYYDTVGRTYSDLFLTKPVACTIPTGGGEGPVRTTP